MFFVFPANNCRNVIHLPPILIEKKNKELNELQDFLSSSGTIMVLSKWALSQAEWLLHVEIKKVDFWLSFAEDRRFC